LAEIHTQASWFAHENPAQNNVDGIAEGATGIA